ncbi:MAG: hypothetical protein SV775_07775 [Thermodesulfobacteriota bacterium]|nr:hypothetical protein [Thermodesulfobacteriota bacterium]
MPKTARRKSLFIGGWILAALVLLVYNGFELTTLLYPNHPTHFVRSRLVDTVHHKWIQFRQLCLEPIKEGKDDIDHVLARFHPPFVERGGKSMIARGGNEEKKNTELPSLKGILQVTDVLGNVRRLAVIDGIRLAEQDTVRGYMLREISDKGVLLEKGDAVSFIPVPEVPFSLNYGGK